MKIELPCLKWISCWLLYQGMVLFYFRRPWYHRAEVNRGRLAVSSVYLDSTPNMGKVITLSRAIHKAIPLRPPDCTSKSGKKSLFQCTPLLVEKAGKEPGRTLRFNARKQKECRWDNRPGFKPMVRVIEDSDSFILTFKFYETFGR